MEDEAKSEWLAVVRKKAAGYTATETQEEFSLVEGEMQLVRRKVTTKEVPPDLSALKLLMEEDKQAPIGREELERERRELTKAYFAYLRAADKHVEAGADGQDDDTVGQNDDTKQ